jgi:hypothetical protein
VVNALSGERQSGLRSAYHRNVSVNSISAAEQMRIRVIPKDQLYGGLERERWPSRPSPFRQRQSSHSVDSTRQSTRLGNPRSGRSGPIFGSDLVPKKWNHSATVFQHRNDLNFVRCELIANHERKTLGNQATIVSSSLMNTRETFKSLNVLKNATDEIIAESILLAVIEPRRFKNVQACLKKKSYDHSASLESPLVHP